MDLSVILPPLGVVIAAAFGAFAVVYSKRNDNRAAQTAAIESQTGMAGMLIAGWQNLVAEGRVREAEGHAREAQLRIDLEACVERARRRRPR